MPRKYALIQKNIFRPKSNVYFDLDIKFNDDGFYIETHPIVKYNNKCECQT